MNELYILHSEGGMSLVHGVLSIVVAVDTWDACSVITAVLEAVANCCMRRPFPL